MEDPVSMQILTTVKQLKHYAFHGGRRNGMPRWLSMMMDDLQQVMLGVLEHHKDTFVFEDDFDEADDIRMT